MKILAWFIPLFFFFHIQPQTLFLFEGPPASGKTTAAKWCVKKLGWKKISIEYLCNQHVEQQTALGKKITPAVTSGALVSDDIIVNMVETALKKEFATNNHVILEGFPKTQQQAERLVDLLEKKFSGTRLIFVQFICSDKKSRRRIAHRYVCPTCEKSYLLTKNSPLVPKKKMSCDVCNTKLVRKKDDAQKSTKQRLRAYRLREKELLAFHEKNKTKTIECSITFDKRFPLEQQLEMFSKQLKGN